MENQRIKLIITAADGKMWGVFKSSIQRFMDNEPTDTPWTPEKLVRTTQITSRGLTFTNLQSVEFVGAADKWNLTNLDNTIELFYDDETWQIQLHRQYCNNDDFEKLKKYYEL